LASCVSLGGLGVRLLGVAGFMHNTQTMLALVCDVSPHPACTWLSLSTCVAILYVRLGSAQTAHMGDKVVYQNEWLELDNELQLDRANARELNLFMTRHVNKKWEIRSVSVGLFAEFTLYLMVDAEKWRASVVGLCCFVQQKRTAVACWKGNQASRCGFIRMALS
jgi:hypothetical protein